MGAEDTQKPGPWLVWMWHHFSLEVHEFATLEAAVAFAEDTHDDGDGSLHAIEGPGTDGDIDAATNAHRQRRRADFERKWMVCVRAPGRDGERRRDWSVITTTAERAKAHELARRWARVVSADRVKVQRRPG